MQILDKTIELSEHKLIDNFIEIWKRIKPSKTYWTLSTIIVLFILREAFAWKWSNQIELYAQNKMQKDSLWNYFWSLIELIFSSGSLELVGIGILILLIVTYAFGKESSSKHYKEVLEKAIDNTKQNNYFINELQKKNNEIDELKEKLENSLPEQEKLILSQQINNLENERDKFEEKVQNLEKKLSEYSNEVEIISEVNKILDSKGISEALEYLENINFEKDIKRSIDNAKALLIKANLYNIQNEDEKANQAYQDSISFNRNFDNSFEYANYLLNQFRNNDAIKQLKILEFNNNMSKGEEGTFYNSLGMIYIQENNIKDAKDNFERSVEIYRLLIEDNFEKYYLALALALKNLANVITNDDYHIAEKLYLEAIDLINKSKKYFKNKDDNILGSIFYNLAILYSKMDVYKSEDMYLKSKKLYIKINNKDNSETNNHTLAFVYSGLASLYTQEIFFKPKCDKYFKYKLEDIESLYLDSLRIFRDLSKNNPFKYTHDLGFVLNNIIRLYAASDRKKDAIELYDEALEKRKSLFEFNNQTFGIQYADILITGVYLDCIDKSSLSIAEEILVKFPTIARAKELLKNIKIQKSKK